MAAPQEHFRNSPDAEKLHRDLYSTAHFFTHCVVVTCNNLPYSAQAADFGSAIVALVDEVRDGSDEHEGLASAYVQSLTDEELFDILLGGPADD